MAQNNVFIEVTFVVTRSAIGYSRLATETAIFAWKITKYVFK